MFKSTSSKFFSFVLFILSMFLLAACSSTPERSRKPSADWGRGLPIGADASGTVGMVVEEDGETIHAVWPFWAQDGQEGIRYIQLDGLAEIKVSKDVVLVSGQARTPRLLKAQNGFLHLIWAARSGTGDKWQLWYAQIDGLGSLQGVPIQISEAGSGALQYVVAESGDGGIWVAWEDVASGGINLIGISALGERQAEVRHVVSAGRKPAIQTDKQGSIYLAWMDADSNLSYERIESSTALPVTGTTLLHIPLGTGATLEAPVLGIADDMVYVFWSILYQSGLKAGTATTEYLVFPQDSVDVRSGVSEIWTLPFEEQPFRQDAGVYSYSELVPAAYINRTSTFIYAPAMVQHPSTEMAVAMASQQEYRLDSNIQIAVAILENGEYKGYTIATKTQAISGDPVLAADGDGNLHLIWQDGVTGENVYYTTTDPMAREVLDRPSLQDITTLILAGGLESLTGILLFPLAFPWMFPGLVVVVIWRLVKNDEDLTNRVSQILLVLSVLLYQGSKVVIFPTMVDYVPFSAWVDIPSAWQLVLRIMVPLLILGISVGVAEWFRRRKESEASTLTYYFVVVVVDTVLTLAIYGVNFLGAY